MDETERRREGRIDRLLIAGMGLSTMVIAAGAVTLIVSPESDPRFSGGEHLAIFAQPSRGLPGATARAALDFGVDPAPVGGLAGPPPSAPAAAGAAPAGTGPLARWRVHDVVGAELFLIGPNGLIAARIGADLGEAGVIERVVIERSGYTVMTTRGRIGQTP